MESQQGNSLSRLNKLYFKISQRLTEDQVKSLRVSLAKDHFIGKGKIQDKTPHEIFEMLEADGKIGDGNLGLLKDLLRALNEARLAGEVEDLERDQRREMRKGNAPDDDDSPNGMYFGRLKSTTGRPPLRAARRDEDMETDEDETGPSPTSPSWPTRTRSANNLQNSLISDSGNIPHFNPTSTSSPPCTSQSMDQGDISRLHSKLGFKVEELKPKAGRKPVKGSSIPLILPNDLKYHASTGKVEKVHGAQRTSLHVVPEALALLEGIEKPVSVLAICGPYRTGKSYILSRLLGTADAFELGHSTDPQTFGIWMGTKVLRGKDFTIVLLDTEGIDSSVGASAGQDASILVMTILLSSQLIYNSLNVPYKTDLEKMQCFIHLAKAVTVKQGEKTRASIFREFFPNFLWLLRDASLKIVDEGGKEMAPTEYLKTKVLGRDTDEFEESQSEKVGRAILTFFPSVECTTLERPSGDSEVMTNIAQHTDSLNPKFNKGVETLIEKLLQTARPKRGYNKASTVSGLALSIMVKQYVPAVNDPDSIPALDNTWQNTVELMRGRAFKEVIDEYNQQMQANVATASNDWRDPLEESPQNETPLKPVTSGRGRGGRKRTRRNTRNPPRQPTLMDLHNELLNKVTDMLLEKVGHFGIRPEERSDENDNLIDTMQKRLVEREERTVEYVAENGTSWKEKGFVVTGGELLRFIQQNKEQSKIFCQKLFERLLEPIRKHVESPPADYDFQQLMEELDKASQQYHEQARGPEKWIVLQEQIPNLDKLKSKFERIEGYKKTIMQEQQKAYEAELRARELAREKQELHKQAQDMQQTQQENLQKVERMHDEQIKKLKQEMKEQHEVALQKTRDLQAAKMEEMANRERERSAREASEFREIIKRMEEEMADMKRQIEELKKPKPSPPSSPPRQETLCTIL